MSKKRGQDAAVLAWMLDVVGKSKYLIVVMTLLQTVLGVSVIGYALFLRGLIDHAVAGDREGFLRYAILLIALVITLAALRWGKRFLEEYSRSTMENRFKRRLFWNLLSRDYGQILATHTAEWMNRLTSDTRVAADGLIQVFPNLCEMAARILAAIAALLVMQPRFAYVIVPGGAILIVVTFIFRTRLKTLHQNIQEKDGELRIFYQERLNSQIVLRVFSKEYQSQEEQEQYLERHRDARMKRNWFSNLVNAGQSIVMNGAYILGAIYCGLGILNGTMTYGMFTAVLQLVGQVQAPFANLSGAFPQFFSMIASSERLREVEEYPSEMEKGSVRPEMDRSFMKAGLRDVRFSYPVYGEEKEETSVLDNFDLELCRGEFLAITGPSGCGKSTVLKVLMALYPIECGSRYVDLGEGEQCLTEVHRGLFAYVPQGNMLIQGSIREIVAFGDADKMGEDEAIWDALRIACAENFVLGLERGLDTVLGEQGSGLSEGQIQRLSIARALFSKRQILLLDEATSALDMETEQQLLHNLREMPNQTVILVTHRPAALEVADRVLELHG